MAQIAACSAQAACNKGIHNFGGARLRLCIMCVFMSLLHACMKRPTSNAAQAFKRQPAQGAGQKGMV